MFMETAWPRRGNTPPDRIGAGQTGQCPASPTNRTTKNTQSEHQTAPGGSDLASTITHSFVGMRLHDGRMPLALKILNSEISTSAYQSGLHTHTGPSLRRAQTSNLRKVLRSGLPVTNLQYGKTAKPRKRGVLVPTA